MFYSENAAAANAVPAAAGAAPAANAFIQAFAGGGASIGDRVTNYVKDKAKSQKPSSGAKSLAAQAAAAPKAAVPAFGGANYWGGAVSAGLEKASENTSTSSSSSSSSSFSSAAFGPSLGAHSLSAPAKSYSGNPARAAAFGGGGIGIGFVGGSITGSLAAVSSLVPPGLEFASAAPAAQLPSKSVSFSSSSGGGAKKKQVTTSSPLNSEFDDSLQESAPADYSAFTCQGCSFTNVQLLNNSFLENFLSGGCAALPESILIDNRSRYLDVSQSQLRRRILRLRSSHRAGGAKIQRKWEDAAASTCTQLPAKVSERRQTPLLFLSLLAGDYYF